MDFWGFSTNEAIIVLRPLLSFVAGMAVYAVFIFKFYRFLARKDIFALDLSRYEKARLRFIRSLLHMIFYVLKYLVIFPFLAFFWFAILTVLLSFLAKNQTSETVLLISIAVVSAVRITSYYDEDLSRDLAKILPFALLGVFLVDFSYFALPATIEILRETLGEWHTMVYYLLFVIVLEFVLRVTTPLIRPHFVSKEDS
jgi:hypothetical protein